MSSRFQDRPEVRDVKATDGTTPPHDLDAEAAVLSAVMLEPGVVEELSGVLRAEDFYSPANRRIWEAILRLAGASEPIDTVTVGGALKDAGRLADIGGVPYLARICDAAPAVANLGAYARRVTQASRSRAMIREAQRIASEGYAAVDIDKYIERSEAAVSALARDTTAASTVSIMKDAVRATFQDIEERAKGLVTPVVTGYADLDWLVVGETGEVHIVGARPGMGKTSFAMGAAINAARRSTPTGSVIFSLEMKTIPLIKRVVASEAGVDLSEMRRGHISSEQWSELTAASQRLSKLPIAIDVCPGISIMAMRSRFRKARADLEAAFPGVAVRLVVVDYLQLMGRNPNSNASNREQEIAEVSRGLTSFALEEDVLITALAQLNRGVESRTDKRPNMADLRESGAIEQDATTVMFLYRDEVYDPNSADVGKCEVIVSKSRNGATGKVKLGFEKTFTRFTNLEAGKW